MFDGSSGSVPLENQTPCFSAWLLQEKREFADLNLTSVRYGLKKKSIAKILMEELSQVYNLPEGLTF